MTEVVLDDSNDVHIFNEEDQQLDHMFTEEDQLLDNK